MIFIDKFNRLLNTITQLSKLVHNLIKETLGFY